MATVTKRLQTHLRKAFDDLQKSFEGCLVKDEYDKMKEVFFQLEDKATRLAQIDQDVLKSLESDDVDETTFQEQFNESEAYRNIFLTCKLIYNKYCVQGVASSTSLMPGTSATSLLQDESSTSIKRKFKLPKIELKSFDGDLRHWIGFWSQFRKIHEDNSLAEEDKFHYLIQCMETGSTAKSLVETYPPCKENYPKVIDHLKTRFGKDNLLIEVFVRDLLQLVLDSRTNKKANSLTELTDMLETKLKALETLGVTSDKYAAMLAPLVESSLPTETLLVWERHRNVKESSEGNKFNHLGSLLEFLKSEVAGEQRLLLVKSTFINNGNSKLKFGKILSADQEKGLSLPTVSSLVAANNSNSFNKGRPLICVFCQKGHQSHDCIKAQQLSLEEKKNILKQNKCCFRCLRDVPHPFKNCKVPLQCVVCRGKHFPIMCPSLAEQALKNAKKEDSRSTQSSSNNLARLINGKLVFLPTLIGKIVVSSGEEIYVRVLLDCGSQNSFILNSVAANLNLPIAGTQDLKLGLFGGFTTRSQNVNIYEITLFRLDSPRASFTCSLMGQNAIANNIPKFHNKTIIKDLESRNILLSDALYDNLEIDILIGADLLSQVLTNNFFKVTHNLLAIETILGWVISGSLDNFNYSKSESLLSVNLMCSNFDFWDLEVMGIRDPFEHKSSSDLEMAALEHFEKTVERLRDGRYQVELPWVNDKSCLPSNRLLAQKRLDLVTKRLINSNLYGKYNDVFMEWLNLGIIEEISDDNKMIDCHYLPHREVIREASNTTKIRPVFDASAKSKGFLSLNDCLEKGPNLLETIPPLLVKFRLHQIAFTADIEKAFLQISLKEEERDYLRFLWWENYENRIYKVYRHSRVVFGVKPSPFLLNSTIVHHLNSDNFPSQLRDTAAKLLHSFYVDNLVGSVSSLSEFEVFKAEAIDVMQNGKFNLREWANTFQDDDSNVKVLGLNWNPKVDFMSYAFNFPDLKDSKLTKRVLLSIVQSCYDPLGLISPILLLPKILYQESCKLKFSWDRILTKEIIEKFFSWFHDFRSLYDLKLSRSVFLFFCPKESWTVHIFCDASAKAYATCIYIRGVFNGNVSLRLLAAKTRIAPLKTVSIPRLELLGACIGTRFFNSIKSSLLMPERSIFFWTDSTVLLHWLHKDSVKSVFVNNRIKEIKSLSSVSQWRFVPGDLNPADIGSRGCSVDQLTSSSWFNGPDWLRDSPENWPINSFEIGKDEVLFLEKEFSDSSSALACTSVEPNLELKSLFRYFSKYSKILRMAAWIFRFSHNARSLVQNHLRRGPLSKAEIDEAEIRLIRLVQEECFSNNNNEPLKRLDFFIDENGLYRLKTKLSWDQSFYHTPIILPKNHILVERLIEEEHLFMHHAGVSTILVKLRERFWVLSARSLVRKIMNRCIPCRKSKASPGSVPVPPLPIDRTDTSASAFQISGVDLCGPFHLKDSSKVYIALFTCAVYRAVHLEIVFSCTTDSFILALRRFIARRGRVQTMYSDNGGNFTGTSNLLDSIDWDVVINDLFLKKIVWKFDPPSSPWWGGWWERLIGVVKGILIRNLGRASLYFEEFETLVVEAEGIVNQRPLTYLSSNPDDLSPIKPADFIQDLTDIEVPDLDHLDSISLCLRKRYVQRIREGLRTRFCKEYLSQLVHRGKNKPENELRVGQVVLIQVDQKRVHWPLGRILSFFPGRDGFNRVALVKTQNREILRPIQKLYPLEC